MARKALIAKSQKKPKFSTRTQRRCLICGRKNSIRHFQMCRCCILDHMNKGDGDGAGWHLGSD